MAKGVLLTPESVQLIEKVIRQVLGEPKHRGIAGWDRRDGGDGGSGLIPVTVDDSGGSPGVDKVSACDLTYDIYAYGATPGTDTPLAEDVVLSGNGNGWRGLNVELTPATVGWAINVGGTWTLLMVDEEPANEQDCA